MRWSSLRIRSNRSSALRCPSWRRNTLTICSRLLERLPPSGFSRLRSGSADATLLLGRIPGRETEPLVVMTAAPAFALDTERRAAAARGGRLGIADGEAASGHRVDEIDLGALEIAHADGVDEQLHAIRLEHLIANAAALLDHEAVLEPRTAAALHEHAQAAAGLVLFGEQLVDLLGCHGGHVDHCSAPGNTHMRRPAPPRVSTDLLIISPAGHWRGHRPGRDPAKAAGSIALKTGNLG